MNFHVLTLFPEMIGAALGTSITGRAMEKGLLSLDAVNIRDFAEEKRKSRIDDYPYGGGAGMVMQAEPVYRAYRSVMDRICEAAAAEKNPAQNNKSKPAACVTFRQPVFCQAFSSTVSIVSPSEMTPPDRTRAKMP